MTNKNNKKKISVIKKGDFTKKKGSKSKVIYHESFDKKKDYIEKKIMWNFKVNDLVYIKHAKEVGVIISDSTYINHRVESNCYFTLVGSRVIQFEGRHLKKLEYVNSLK